MRMTSTNLRTLYRSIASGVLSAGYIGSKRRIEALGTIRHILVRNPGVSSFMWSSSTGIQFRHV